MARGALEDACDPYQYCDDPTEPTCSNDTKAENAETGCPSSCADGSALTWHKAASAYAVGAPGDVEAMQRARETAGRRAQPTGGWRAVTAGIAGAGRGSR